MSIKKGLLFAGKVVRARAKQYSALASRIEREPNKKWISKYIRQRSVGEFAGIAHELMLTAIEIERYAKEHP